jgi:hypothetical protein
VFETNAVDDDDDVDAEPAGVIREGKTTLVLVDLLVGDAGGEGDEALRVKVSLLPWRSTLSRP